MKQKWLELAARFDSRVRRERALIAAAIIVGGGMLGYSFLIKPQIIRQANQVKRISQATTDLAAIEAQLTTMQTMLKDPDAANRSALEQSRKDLAVLESKIRAIESSMVPPDKMQIFLESLLSKNRNLELLALKTIDPTPLVERSQEKKADTKADTAPAAAPGAPTKGAPSAAPSGSAGAAFSATPNIYKHGVELKIAGSYNDLLMYLAEIERMPQRIIWNRIKFASEQYPRNEMTLTVFTLSLDKQWLVV
ncbi:MAG: type II secretion system protein M [Betaproteobacteria bacterium]|nr:type II secretion system protein M [Betaproteobacteria bacterium]